MKTLITLSTILAAGTLAVNAATTLVNESSKLLWGFDFTSTTLDASTGAVTGLSGSGTINTSGGVFDGTGSYTTDTSGSNRLIFTASGDDTSNLAGNAGTFSISFHAKYSDGSSDWPVLMSLGSSTSNQWKLTYYKNDTTIVMDKDGYTSDVNPKVIGTYSPTEAWTHYVLTYNSDKTFSLYVNGSLIGTTGATNLTSSDPMKCFAFGGRIDNDTKPSAMTFSDIAIYSGVLGTSQISYLTTHKANETAIPEPSAFGLLAGIGALALAGTRRRRKMR